MTQAEIEQLIQKYANDTCSADEKAIVEAFYNQAVSQRGTSFEDEDFDAVREIILARLPASTTHSKRRWLPLSVAASLLVCLGIWMYMRPFDSAQDTVEPNIATVDIPPGGNKAVLTLADGSSIFLSDAQNGELVDMGNVRVTKVEDGKLLYNSTNTRGQSSESSFNRMETPDGGQYQLILPDGTKVWLNARSALRFPTDFKALGLREVYLEGEAFFEVAHNREKPFLVHTGNQTVKVLGTQFNINAYANEASVQTTLLEGSVQLWQRQNEARKVELKPGQQATANETDIRVSAVNSGDAVAWKNGFFQLDKINVETFLRQVERWYGVEVEYKGKKPQGHYIGKVPRSEPLSAVRELLQYFNIQTELIGTKLIVSQGA